MQIGFFACVQYFNLRVTYLTLRLNCNNFFWNLTWWPPFWIFITWFLSNGSPWAIDYPPLYQIWRNNVERRWNYGRKSKSKMAAVRHLGFVTWSYWTIHEVYSLGYIGLSNFMLIRCIVLKIWRFEFFVDLAWNAYSPKFWFLGVKTPKRDWSSSRLPKGTSLAETAITCQF